MQLTDGQYYAFVIFMSTAAGCMVELMRETFMAYWHMHQAERVLAKKRLRRAFIAYMQVSLPWHGRRAD
jgi:hypothetical protein